MSEPWRKERVHDLWVELRSGYGQSNRMIADCLKEQDADRILATSKALANIPDPEAFMAEVWAFVGEVATDIDDRVSGGIKHKARVLLAQREGK